MPIATTLAAIAAVTAVASTGASVVASQKQQKAEKKARSTERQTAAIENARRVRRAIAERRIRQAEIISAAENQGVGIQSSSPIGAVGALGSDTASQIGGLNTLVAGNQLTSDFRFQGAKQFAKYQGISNILGTASQLSFAGSQFARAGSQPRPDPADLPGGR